MPGNKTAAILNLGSGVHAASVSVSAGRLELPNNGRGFGARSDLKVALRGKMRLPRTSSRVAPMNLKMRICMVNLFQRRKKPPPSLHYGVKSRRGSLCSALRCERRLEAAGVEPASRAEKPAATTCLVGREFSAVR